MFSNSLLKYNYIRKKHFFGQNYNISSFELFELILTKKIIKPKFNLFEFLTNLISLILSMITILKCKLLKLDKINYYIVFNNNLSDPRSNNINSIFKSDKNINIIKTSGLSLSLLVYFKINNVILHESIVYFSRFFFIEKRFTLKEKFKNIHKCKIRQNLIYFKIFKFLKIRKLLMIDDYREIQSFVSICKKLNIKTLGYMHSRFSKYRVSLKYDCFDKYIVWTEFFKKKLIEINPKYKDKILINNFRNFKRISHIRTSTKITVLFFSDTMMDYKSVIKYLDQLKRENIRVLVRLKSNQKENKYFLKYLKRNNFIKANDTNIEKIVKKYKPKFFMATNSNILLEATLYNCLPIILKTQNDYSFDLIKDNIAICYSGKKNIYQFLKKLENKKNLINDIYNKIWNSKYEIKNIKRLF